MNINILKSNSLSSVFTAKLLKKCQQTSIHLQMTIFHNSCQNLYNKSEFLIHQTQYCRNYLSCTNTLVLSVTSYQHTSKSFDEDITFQLERNITLNIRQILATMGLKVITFPVIYPRIKRILFENGRKQPQLS